MLPEDFFRVFPGLNRAYGQFFITERKGPKLDGYGKTVRESYETKLWKEHLDGKTGLGVIPIDENNQCKWACLDVDDYSVDIEKISKQFVKKNLIVCRSKSGGAHTYLYLLKSQ